MRFLRDILKSFISIISTASVFLRFGIPEIVANFDALRKLEHNGAPQTMISMYYLDTLSREL